MYQIYARYISINYSIFLQMGQLLHTNNIKTLSTDLRVLAVTENHFKAVGIFRPFYLCYCVMKPLLNNLS